MRKASFIVLVSLLSACNTSGNSLDDEIRISVSNDYIVWEQGERISVCDDGGIYSFTALQKGKNCVFSGLCSPNSTERRLVWPEYGKSHSIASTQYAGDGPDRESLVMGGGQGTNSLVKLNPVVSVVRLSVSPSDISRITLSGKNSETLSGTFSMSFTPDEGIRLTPSKPSPQVSLTSPSVGCIEPGIYSLVVFPADLSSGYTIQLTKDDGGIVEFEGEPLDMSTPGTYSIEIGTSVIDDSLFGGMYRKHCIEYIRKQYGTASLAKKADKVLSAQHSDGSWDINYKDSKRSGWDACEHIDNIFCLASAAYENSRKDCLDALVKALEYWTTAKPVCTNWYYNEIRIPRDLGPAIILVRDMLSDEAIAMADQIMAKATISMTGMNKVNLSMNCLMKGIIDKDEALVMKAWKAMVSEVKVTTSEGIQPDWSFHQHGAQLQFGNYGLEFSSRFSEYYNAFHNTPLELPDDVYAVLRDYTVNGLSRVVWKGYFDMSACGRQVTPGSQTSKANSLKTALKNFGLPDESFVGPTYFPRSDFGVYRTDNWYASVRMQSKRTVGYEQTNTENMRSYFSSDGAVLVRRKGDEYYDVPPVWNWRHVPGVTCYDNGTDLYGNYSAKTPYNKSSLVFGQTSDKYMAAAMELDRDGLSARKVWFFTPECIVCLGTGISRAVNERVTTGVDQCRLTGTVDKTDKWINHNGITYIPIDGDFKVDPSTHSGTWKRIYTNGSTDVQTMELLDIYVDHGNAPSNASYAFVIVPTGQSAASAREFVDSKVKIVSNSGASQVATVNGISFSVDWASGTAVIK